MGSTTTEDLTLPRILCLHGGGVTADIFRAQSRSFISALRHRFRLVFADGPFFCDPGPGMIPVYEGWGPYRRWLRWLPEHAEVDADSAIEEINYNIETAMRDDPGTGEWVGLLGFSQGAKLAASLLFEQQIRLEKLGPQAKNTNFRFAVLLAGRAPLVSLSDLTSFPSMIDAGQISEGFDFDKMPAQPVRLALPTIHVHGLQDPGVHLHRILMERYCDPAAVRLVEWDGTHRVPLKKADVDKVVGAVLEVADREGV